MLVETKSKNENGIQYEAQIFEVNGSYTVNYLKNGEKVSSQSYTGMSLPSVQAETSQWINSIGVLNG